MIHVGFGKKRSCNYFFFLSLCVNYFSTVSSIHQMNSSILSWFFYSPDASQTPSPEQTPTRLCSTQDLGPPRGASDRYEADSGASSPGCAVPLPPPSLSHPSQSCRLLPHPASLSLCLIKVMYLSMKSVLKDYRGSASAGSIAVEHADGQNYITSDGETTNQTFLHPKVW